MPLRDKRRLWRCFRIALRRVRVAVLFLILALLVALLYLNQIGLPDFVKQPLLARLRTRGLDLQFSRLSWRWSRGLVAENVHFGQANDPASPQLALREVEVRLDYAALAHLRLQVNSLVLQQGRLSWPVLETNRPPRELLVRDIQTQLRLLPGDLWQLDHFQAQFAGANVRLTGTVTNASAIRGWSWFQPKAHAPARSAQNRARRLADLLEQIHFAAPAQLYVALNGDARRPRSFAIHLKLDTPEAHMPWGTVGPGSFSFRMLPGRTNEPPRAEARLKAERVRTRWAAVTNLAFTLRLAAALDGTKDVHVHLNGTAGNVETKWGNAASARFTAQWIHALTNAIPLSGRGELSLAGVGSRWGSATQVQLSAMLSGPAHPAATGEASWAWWTNVAPYALDWKCDVSGVRSPKLTAAALSCEGYWRAPELNATRISARLYGGSLDAQARLNVDSRELHFRTSSDFNVRGISALLTPASRHWLAQYAWDKPPVLQAEGSLVLPRWTDQHPDWRREVKPTVTLRGHFRVGQAAFRGVSVTMADSDFTYSNETWRLPDLVAGRPEGSVDVFLESNEPTRDYHFRIHSTMDLRALRPLLEPAQQRGLDLVGWTQPPVIDGEIWGRWYDHDRIGFRGRVAVTNFTFRGQRADGLQTALSYTNRVLELIEPRIERGRTRLSAGRVTADFRSDKVYITNGFSTADPLAVARAIGPHIGHDFEPYHFSRPPRVHVEGVIPMRDPREADLHFDVDGGPFAWWKINVPRIAGRVDWVGQTLALKHVHADFYRGSGVGYADFDFRPKEGTDFRFDAVVTNANLHLLMNDLSGKTNQLQGQLTARLNITHASSKDWRSWQGNGRARLRNGLIWEIPIFGILSPVLDGIMPGLGSSTASEGSATFTIKNGVVHSDDVEIKASAMRLQYWGTVDFQGRVNAHAEAELLRDTWVVGRVLSLALWPVSKIFEYKITGTLHDPRSEPIFFVPRLVLLPFHPLRTMKELTPAVPTSLQTNGPPAQLP